MANLKMSHNLIPYNILQHDNNSIKVPGSPMRYSNNISGNQAKHIYAVNTPPKHMHIPVEPRRDKHDVLENAGYCNTCIMPSIISVCCIIGLASFIFFGMPTRYSDRIYKEIDNIIGL